MVPAGQCGLGAADPQTISTQYFPYPVRDVYGTVVLPENLKHVAPEPYNHNPPAQPERHHRVGDGSPGGEDAVASFFYHPFLGVDRLRETTEGIKALGYEFVSPLELARGGASASW